jgi:hypothetical protein
MLESLDHFKSARKTYEGTLSETADESTESLQVIKKEVLDIADMADKLAGLIVSQQR